MIVEFPGYSIYNGITSEENIIDDIDPIWNFVTKIMNFEKRDIIVMGRSIGSGPATHLAQQHECGSLVLISPFKSLKCVAHDNFGVFGSSFLKQRFENEEKMKRIKCPCLFIHGKDDTLIPFEHSKALYSKQPLSSRFMRHAGGNTYILWDDTPVLRH